jgi:glycosyltransferase involved in cell wall biosynthesis
MVRNEEGNIRGALRKLAAAAELPHKLEVVVVDSGCTDQTIPTAQNEARSLPLSVVFARSEISGRGAALDAGTAVASGEVIFVCHCDCVVPKHFDRMIRDGLARPGTLATAFRFGLDRAALQTQPLPGAGVMEFTVNVRSSLLQLPFGDQGIAICATRLQNYGGWGGAEYPLLEEYQLVQKLRVRTPYNRGQCLLSYRGWFEFVRLDRWRAGTRAHRDDRDE